MSPFFVRSVAKLKLKRIDMTLKNDSQSIIRSNGIEHFIPLSEKLSKRGVRVKKGSKQKKNRTYNHITTYVQIRLLQCVVGLLVWTAAARRRWHCGHRRRWLHYGCNGGGHVVDDGGASARAGSFRRRIWLVELRSKKKRGVNISCCGREGVGQLNSPFARREPEFDRRGRTRCVPSTTVPRPCWSRTGFRSFWTVDHRRPGGERSRLLFVLYKFTIRVLKYLQPF